MPRLEFADIARQDLFDIQDHISKDSMENAIRWTDRIIDKCKRLAENPGVGTMRPDILPGLLSFPVGNYLILYRLTDDLVSIARVVHGARELSTLFNPGE
jgi:toxin ParE1/3/4